MNMQGPTRTCVSQQQATRSVLVYRIVFDDCTPGNGVADFLHADLAEDALVNSVLRELDPSSPELLPNKGQSVHDTITGSLYKLRTLTWSYRARMVVGLVLATSSANVSARVPVPTEAQRLRVQPVQGGTLQAKAWLVAQHPSRQPWKGSLNVAVSKEPGLARTASPTSSMHRYPLGG